MASPESVFVAVQPFLAMHAPDGLFTMPVNIVFAVLVVAVLALAGARLARRRDHRLAPTMGVMAAFVFAAQMVNFPVASGTTGHLLGGTLAAILLGPWAGTMVMAAVIVFQALLGDGGITVLGPNIFSMGVVGTCLAYYVYRLIVGNAAGSPARVVGGSFFAAWLAVVLASVFVSLQLAVSGTAALHRAMAAMVTTHMVIGIGEALITAAVVAFVLKTRPELLYGRVGETAAPRRGFVIAGLVGSLVVAAFFSLLPTLWDYPDGLEKVGIEMGFLPEESPRIALLPDYTIPGIQGLLSTSLAGVLGTVVMFVASFAVGRVFTRPGKLEAAFRKAAGETDDRARSR